MTRRASLPGPLSLLGVCLFSVAAAAGQSYTLTPQITSIPAASYGSSIHAGVTGDTSPVLDFNVCFYTGYGSTAPIVPTAFTPASGGAAQTIFAIPSSPIQEIPPSAFTNGVFNGLLYTVPLSATSCNGASQAANAITLPINFPILSSLSLSSVPQQNSNLNSRLPGAIELVGSNFVSQTRAAFPSPSSVIFSANGSFAGNVSFINATALASSIPTQIPGDATSVQITVCNTAVFTYCSAALPLAMKPLGSDFGTLTAVPSTGTAQQPINLSATFGPGSPTTAGAPSGLVSFTDAGTAIASSSLLLDTSASFVSAPRASFQSTSLPLDPIVADFNNDGVPDLVFLEPNANPEPTLHFPVIHIVLGTSPAGQFGPDVPYNGLLYVPCATAISMVTGDFNGDGYLDLAVLCQNTSASGAISEVVYTLLNKHNGALSYVISSFGPVYGSSLAAADFNHDGKTDLVVAGALAATDSTGLQVLLGKGDGTFTAGPASTGLDTASSAGFEIAAADFNNDGFPDLAILNAAGAGGSVDNFIQLFQNDGKGNFTRSATVQTDGTSTAKFFIAPLLPGQPKDLIVTSSAGPSPGISIVPNLSAADVAFASNSQFTSVPRLAEAFVGDFNGDGFLDLAVHDATSFHILTGDGTGNFTATYPTLSVTPPSGAALIAASDVNGDGYADLLAVSSTAVAKSGKSTTTVYGFITSGTASASVIASNLASGVHRIIATTPGTVELAGASAQATVTITGSSPVTSIAASVNSPQSFGQAIILFGSVLDPAATGTLSFYSGTTLFGTSPLSTAPGAAFASGSITLQPLPAGIYSFQVVYSGDSTHASTTSAILPFKINAIPPVVAWTPSVASVAYGTPLSASQLDAVASGLAGANVPGTFAYTPALGTVLGIGTQTLSVTFTPASTNYLPATATAAITVNPATPVIVWAPNPATIVYGTVLSAAQLDAYAATPNVNTVPGTFTYSPAIGTLLTAGPQTLNVAFTPTDGVNYRPASLSIAITVTKATPALTWPTPADTVAGTVLSTTQLDAAAAAVDGSALSGTFTYTPPAGTVLANGSQKLSVLFVPTDTVDYTSASASVTINVTPDTLASLYPNTGSLGDPATTVTLTGTGFLPTSVVQMNGLAVPTTFLTSKTLTAIVPAVQLKTVQAIQVTVNDPIQNQTSNALAFTVTAPSTTVAVNAPATITPASQNTVTFQLSPYPADVDALFTLAFQPASGLTDDPMIVFASSGQRTATAHVAAHTDVVTLPIEFESGTVAGTLTLTLVLQAGGAIVTPASIQPIVIAQPLTVPGISSVTLQPAGNTLTVITRGYSNSRAVSSASFHFTASSGNSVKTPDLTVNVDPLFTTWYTNPTSQQYGSEFTYTETFNLDSNASAIGQVSVTLTNDSGTSQEANTP